MQYSLYLHIPFCRHRCAYCDFSTYARQERLIPAYVKALCREIEHIGAHAPDDLDVHTVFFGGGTPSLLSPLQIGAILGTVGKAFRVREDAEITLEANPGTVSRDSLGALRAVGINRISFGLQSANAEELRLMERQHTFLDVLEAVSAARRAGFSNLSVDLIFGLPDQELRTWQTTVRRVLDLRPEHVSAYALTLEHGTPFGQWARKGSLPTPDPDLAADMYEWFSSELDAAGFFQYEISNWSVAGRECQHNLQYWRRLPYVGLGAGAHGYAGGYRYSNIPGIANYMSRFNSEPGGHDGAYSDGGWEAQTHASIRGFPFSPATIDHHQQSAGDEITDFMITGLRLTREGIAANDFRRRFGRNLRDVYAEQLSRLVDLELLRWSEPQSSAISSSGEKRGGDNSEILRLSKRGRLLGNQVFMEFISPTNSKRLPSC